MATQRAIVMQGDQKVALVTDRLIPKLRPGYVLVEVKAVALNPTDWQHKYYINTPGALMGCDYAGLVAETGTGYNKEWKKGDRICGFVHGGNNLQLEDGAFAEYIVAKADIQMKIPDDMSFEDASTLGVAVVSAGQGLYEGMALDLPNEPGSSGEPILIYGGSSAMGTMGIQLAKLSGYTPLATSSPRNFDLVKFMGVVEVFDYQAADCTEQIKKYTNNNLKLVWDTICMDAKGNPSAVMICSEVLAPGGKYGALQNITDFLPRDDIKLSWTLGYVAIGEPVVKGPFHLQDNAKHLEFMTKWASVAESLLAEGKIKVHPPIVGKGLEGALEGMELLKSRKVSGNKLVYTV